MGRAGESDGLVAAVDANGGAQSAQSAQSGRGARQAALRGHLAMLTFAAMISVSFSLGKRAAPYLSAEAITAARFLVAACIIGVIAAPALRWAHFRALWRYGVIGGLFATYFVLMFEALRLTDPVSVAAVFTLIPAMTAVCGWFLLGQRASRRAAGALLLGAIGALWVIFRGDPARLAAFDLGPGEAIFFVGCVAHAVYTPMTKRLSRGEPAPVFALGALLAGLLVTLVWGGEAAVAVDWLGLPAIAQTAVLYMGIVATAATFVLTRYAAARLPSGKVMAYGYLVPVFVILWEGLFTGVWVAGVIWVGVLATVAALVILLAEHDP